MRHNRRNKIDRLTQNKRRSLALSLALDQIGEAKAAHNVGYCQTRLDTDVFDVGGIAEEIVTGRYSCKHLLCPQCQAARAARNLAVLVPILDHVRKTEPNAPFQHWTLTFGATTPGETGQALGAISKGWTQPMRNSAYRAAVLGSIRCLEVTRNDVTGLLHAHAHCLVALHPRYYAKEAGRYVTADQLRADWSRKVGRPVSQIHMGAIGARDDGPDGLRQALVEVAKYAFKPTDLYSGDDNAGWRCNPEAVRSLLGVLRRRRKMSLSGVFYEARQQLKLPDPDDDGSPDFDDIHDPRLAPFITALVRIWDEPRCDYRVLA